jgi:hypothetical protein
MLVLLVAATGALLLYPYADLPHVLMVLPMFLPLTASVLADVVAPTATASATTRAIAVALAVGWPIAAMLPFLRQWQVARQANPPAVTFPRATGLRVPGPKAADAALLVRDLAAREAAVFVLSNEQMVYFLAGVRSPLEREEFVLYVVAADLIRDEDARAMADQDHMIDALASSHAVVVDVPDSPASGRVRRAFPRLAAFIDDAYGPPLAVGEYRVRTPASMARPGSAATAP